MSTKPVVQIVHIGKEKALAVLLNKDALWAIKDGQTFVTELIHGETKTKVLFMRDTTFTARMQDFKSKEKAEAELKKVADGIEKDVREAAETLAQPECGCADKCPECDCAEKQ